MTPVNERRDVVILGSTGSVGTQALDVVRAHPDRFRVVGLTAGGSQEQHQAAADGGSDRAEPSRDHPEPEQRPPSVVRAQAHRRVGDGHDDRAATAAQRHDPEG